MSKSNAYGNKILNLMVSVLFIALLSCEGGVNGSGQGSGEVEIELSGVAVKGPLQSGGEIAFKQIDFDGVLSGEAWAVSSFGNTASFSSSMLITEHLVGVSAKGVFFNEITGVYSDYDVELESLSYLKLGPNTLNINLLTHLISPRVLALSKALVDQDLDLSNEDIFLDARAQAQSEFFEALKEILPKSNTQAFEHLSLFNKDPDADEELLAGNNYLIAATAIIFKNLLEKHEASTQEESVFITDSLNDLRTHFSETGEFPDGYLLSLKETVSGFDPAVVEEHLKELLANDDVLIAEIAKALDSDFDGLTNDEDLDDDNDGVNDDVDEEPFSPQKIKLALGREHSCALKNGAVVCWGDNAFNQTDVPADLAKVLSMSTGDYHTCSLGEDGVRCWGANLFSQSDVPELTAVKKIVTGSAFSCTLLESGVVTCWGMGSVVASLPVFSSATNISGNNSHACVVDDTGLTCWGDNGDEQLDVPAGLGDIQQLASGGWHNCALDENGVHCWGRDVEGQSTPPALDSATILRAGDLRNSCAVQDKTLQCWGENTSGELDGPSVLSSIENFDMGAKHVCATDNLTIECWGESANDKTTVPEELK